LGKNILCGNSLIGTDIIGTEAWNAMTEEERRRINPFDYERAFPGVFRQGGFDAVIGNPPYIRIQNLSEEAAAYFSTNYASAVGKYDIYLPFVEAGLQMLKLRGRLSFILPNKFFTADYGVGLRKTLARENAVDRIVDFRDAQVFPGATTYTCILVLARQDGRRQWTSVTGSSPGAGIAGIISGSQPWHEFTLDADGAPWHLADRGSTDLLQRLMSAEFVPLADVADRIFQGLISGADKLLYLPVARAKELGIEKELLHPVLKGREVRRFFIEPCEFVCLFPYALVDGRTTLIEESVLRCRYPNGYRYLASIREPLEARGSATMEYPCWYAYWCERDQNALDSAKLVTQVLAKGNKIAFDHAGEHYFVGGGNAGVYGITIPAATQASGYSYSYVLGLLNSRVAEWIIQQLSSRFRGGYYSYAKRFIEQVRLAPPKTTSADRLGSLVDAMLSLKKRLAAECLPQRQEQINREIEATDRQIDRVIYQLYGLNENDIAIIEQATS